MKAVCDRYGVLSIFDEVMCGMGRTGTLHAWEAEGVVPDIDVIGKSLGAGYIPISAVLVTERVDTALQEGSKYFKHGQTYQSHRLACAAALEVQRIVQNQKLVEMFVTWEFTSKRYSGRGLRTTLMSETSEVVVSLGLSSL